MVVQDGKEYLEELLNTNQNLQPRTICSSHRMQIKDGIIRKKLKRTI